MKKWEKELLEELQNHKPKQRYSKKLKKYLTEKIVKRIKGGMPVVLACEPFNLDPNTFQSWVEDDPYLKLQIIKAKLPQLEKIFKLLKKLINEGNLQAVKLYLDIYMKYIANNQNTDDINSLFKGANIIIKTIKTKPQKQEQVNVTPN